MKVQIKHRYTSAILFESDISDDVQSRLCIRYVLERAVESNVNLSYADLRNADLHNANLRNADLHNADLSYADLSWADLRYAILSDANLRYANLSDATLRDTNLRRATLSYADLRKADLSCATLSHVNLSYVNLNHVNLNHANLSYADLSCASLGDAKLIGARPILQIGPIGSRADYLTAYITDQGLRFDAGCQHQITRAVFEERLVSTHGDNDHAREYRAALTLIDEHVKIWTPKETETVSKVPSEQQS